jgi:hypothetical protein
MMGQLLKSSKFFANGGMREDSPRKKGRKMKMMMKKKRA